MYGLSIYEIKRICQLAQLFHNLTGKFSAFYKFSEKKSLKPKFTFRHLKKGIQEFHRKFVLAPADKAANNVVVV